MAGNDSAPVVCFLLRFDHPVDGDAANRVFSALEITDGISPHNLRFAGTSNRELLACVHIEAPITAERRALAHDRVKRNLTKGLATIARDVDPIAELPSVRETLFGGIADDIRAAGARLTNPAFLIPVAIAAVAIFGLVIAARPR